MQREKSLIYKGKRHLPFPSGPYTVGCSDFITSYMKFGIFVRLYYPSKEQGIVERHLQWPQWIPHKQYINGYATKVGIPPPLYRLIHRILVGDLYIPVIWQAELRPTNEKYPVIVFSHGLSGWRTTYSSICMELASRGFVVAALEHRDRSASACFYEKSIRESAIGSTPGSDLRTLDGLFKYSLDFENEIDGKWELGPRMQDIGPWSHTKEWMLYLDPSEETEMYLRTKQVKYRARECSEALDLLEDLNLGRYVCNVSNSNFNSRMFKGQLDLSKSFFIGHSFGGATGIYCLATELRFRAGIFLDPWMYPFYEDTSCFSMLSQPFLCLLIKSFQTKESMKFVKKLQRLNKDAEFLVLKKAKHRDVSDAPFVPKFSFSLSTKLGRTLEKFSALDITVDLILRFFGQKLAGGYFQAGSSKLEKLKQKFISEEDFSSLPSDSEEHITEDH